MALSLNKPKLDNLAGDIWKSAERLRGKFKAYEYQNVILPIIVIRRLECVLIDWREKRAAEVLAKRPKLTEKELAKLVKELELNPKQCPFSNKTDWTLRNVYEEDHALLRKTSAPTSTASPRTWTTSSSTSIIGRPSARW
jgi:type I restriction enzyme M protein